MVPAKVYACLCGLSVLPGQPLLLLDQDSLSCELGPTYTVGPQYFGIAHDV